ncbi:hypothetical protein [Planococcus glaciei]|uniref:hypothetical protein n=1 Tax=Planococcus glaciei TaxID=459472 RepID=UPI001C737E0F|nr:hypothetical protein [Planococcus glaciei]MBX0313328.1 hypothetical protein [Planococcus glaciei]
MPEKETSIESQETLIEIPKTSIKIKKTSIELAGNVLKDFRMMAFCQGKMRFWFRALRLSEGLCIYFFGPNAPF